VIFDVENQGQFTMQPIQIEVLSPEQLTEYAGEYYSERLMTTYTIGVSDGMLHIRLPRQSKSFALTPKIQDSFSTPPELSGASINFQRNSMGEIIGILVRLPMNRVKPIVFIKK